MICTLEREEVSNFDLDQLESQLQNQFRGRIGNLRLVLRGRGIVLKGLAHSFHAKQLVQHAVMAVCVLPLMANEIAVVRPQREPQEF